MNGNDIETSQKIYNSYDPILFDDLTKKFGDFTAVKSLKMSIRKGEVFTILGHNGAGKTTAIYMLTGMYKPSGGNAYVYGYNIRDNIDQV
jgi:ABC-2 type transport system ATP-binding protein